MAATLEIVNEKLVNASKEVFKDVFAYISAITEPADTFFKLSKEQQEILDKQVNLSPDNYITSTKLMQELKVKYGL
jgi:hypothetical protein